MTAAAHGTGGEHKTDMGVSAISSRWSTFVSTAAPRRRRLLPLLLHKGVHQALLALLLALQALLQHCDVLCVLRLACLQVRVTLRLLASVSSSTCTSTSISTSTSTVQLPQLLLLPLQLRLHLALLLLLLLVLPQPMLLLLLHLLNVDGL